MSEMIVLPKTEESCQVYVKLKRGFFSDIQLTDGAYLGFKLGIKQKTTQNSESFSKSSSVVVVTDWQEKRDNNTIIFFSPFSC